MQPFWANCEDRRLYAVWRQGAAPRQVWVLCPPFAEEEKSARYTLNAIARALQQNGHSSLLFSFSGCGDSASDFAQASLDDWRADIIAMCETARRRAPEARLALLGVRLGASLAAQVAQQCGADELCLLEPLLDGKSYLAQLNQRRRLRGMLTDPAQQNSTNSEDLDGWPLGQILKTQLEDLQLHQTPLPAQTQIWQIGARRQPAPALQQWAASNELGVKVLLMPPFWNRLDMVSPQPLLEALQLTLSSNEPSVRHSGAGRNPAPSDANKSTFTSPSSLDSGQPRNDDGETPFLLSGKSGALAAMLHWPEQPKSTFIVMLHGWSGYRSGPHQMQTRAARHFARWGYPVLRFDFAGRGDSDGDAGLTTLATMKDDLDCVREWIKSTFPGKDIILAGLCSGCEIAFAGAAAPEISGLMLWSAPVFAADASQQRTRRKRWHHLGEYARKLLRPATYRKLLRGEVDARGVSKVLSHQGGESKNIENDLPGQLPRGWRQAVMDANRHLYVPALLIYGSADPTAAEASSWYETHLSRKCPLEKSWIEGANHSYYGLAWEAEVIARSGEWLEKYF